MTLTFREYSQVPRIPELNSITFGGEQSAKPKIPGLHRLAEWVRREERWGGGSSAAYRAKRLEDDRFRIERLTGLDHVQYLCTARNQAHAERMLDYYVAHDLTIRRLLSGRSAGQWTDFFDFNLHVFRSTAEPN